MPFTDLLQSDVNPQWQPPSQQQYQQYSMAQAHNYTWFPTGQQQQLQLEQQQQQLQLEQQQQQLQPEQRHQEVQPAWVLYLRLECYIPAAPATVTAAAANATARFADASNSAAGS